MFPLYENLTYSRTDLPIILYNFRTSDKNDQIIHMTNYTSDDQRESLTAPCGVDYTHWHSSYEILLINSDETELYINGDHIQPQKGDVILIDAFDIHNVGVKHDHYVLLVDPARLAFTGDVFPNSFNSKWIRKNGPYEDTRHLIETHIYTIRDKLLESARPHTLGILGQLYLLFDCILLHRETAEEGHRLVDPRSMSQADSHGSQKETLKRIFNFIEQNYGNDINLSDIASVAGFNESYFCRFFKNATGRTPVEYLNEFRCQIARRRLESSEDSITEIALECGFSSVSYFSRMFKKYFKVSPRAYAARLKAQS